MAGATSTYVPLSTCIWHAIAPVSFATMAVDLLIKSHMHNELSDGTAS